MNFSLKDKTGFRPVKKYRNFILFEKNINGTIIRETFYYNELPLFLSKEDRKWIEKN